MDNSIWSDNKIDLDSLKEIHIKTINMKQDLQNTMDDIQIFVNDYKEKLDKIITKINDIIIPLEEKKIILRPKDQNITEENVNVPTNV
jgi:hypothetical protein